LNEKIKKEGLSRSPWIAGYISIHRGTFDPSPNRETLHSEQCAASEHVEQTPDE
jgi:hypothetical protein